MSDCSHTCPRCGDDCFCDSTACRHHCSTARLSPGPDLSDLHRENKALRERAEKAEAEVVALQRVASTEQVRAALEKSERERDEAAASLEAALEMLDVQPRLWWPTESCHALAAWQRVRPLLEARRG